MRLRSQFSQVLTCATALLLGGCAGYHLGPTNEALAGARSIEIAPFQNKTSEPGLVDYTISSLRKDLQQDGTYRIDTHDRGDVIVSGVITSYDRAGLSVQPADVLTVVDYQISMTVKLTARDRVTGKVLLDQVVKGRTSLRAGADLASAEREMIPVLAEDFARNATAALVNGTW